MKLFFYNFHIAFTRPIIELLKFIYIKHTFYAIIIPIMIATYTDIKIITKLVYINCRICMASTIIYGLYVVYIKE